MIDEELLTSIEEKEDRHNAVAKLIELGRKKTFVTYDDILQFFPEAEQDVDQLEKAFSDPFMICTDWTTAPCVTSTSTAHVWMYMANIRKF